MRLAVSASMGAALLMMASVQADPAAGQKVFQEKGCQDCHYTDGPAKEKTIADQQAKKGPELWYAGSKFQKAWLNGWLQDPKPVRLLKYNSLTEDNPGDHPKLAGAEAGAVTDFLMSLTSAEVKKGVVKPKRNAKGRLIFTKKMPCSGCHQYPKKKKLKGGKSAPSLAGAGTRLNPDWIYAYLAKPEVFKPVKMMPVFAGIMKDRDMKKVAAHVASFK
ncbi:MAG: c-type cytochrome [Gammaproteobacteria bacterium]|nr:c-type cytochrome [Gammaproteobacteria bacterium]